MISLKKIDSAELDKEVNLIAHPEKIIEELEGEIAQNFYQGVAISQLGEFAILEDGKVAGIVSMSPSKDRDFASNQTVNVEFCYYLGNTFQGRGLGHEALKIALATLAHIKTTGDNIECTNYHPWSKQTETFAASTLGAIYAYVDEAVNYPSLSVSLKNGGVICAIGGTGGDGIFVTFADSYSENHVSRDFAAKLTQYSKQLCQNNWQAAFKTAKMLIQTSEDSYAKIVIAQSVHDNMVQFFGALSSDSDIYKQLATAYSEIQNKFEYPDFADGYFGGALPNAHMLMKQIDSHREASVASVEAELKLQHQLELVDPNPASACAQEVGFVGISRDNAEHTDSEFE